MVITGAVMMFGAGTTPVTQTQDYLSINPYGGSSNYPSSVVKTEISDWFWIGLCFAGVGGLVSMIDAPLYADNYNKRFQKGAAPSAGNLLEFPAGGTTLGLDFTPPQQLETARNIYGPQMTASLRF